MLDNVCEAIKKVFKENKIENFSLISLSYNSEIFGDAEVVFQCNSLMFKILRDRGQYFAEVASALNPKEFFYFFDVVSAIGSTTSNLKQEPYQSLKAILEQILDKLSKFEEFFSQKNKDHTIKKIFNIQKQRKENLFQQ